MSDIRSTTERTAELADRLVARLLDPELVASASVAAASIRADPLRADPLDRLRGALGLSAFEVDLIRVVGLPEEHAALSAAVSARHPRGRPVVTPGLVAQVLGLDCAGTRALRRALTAGPLVRAEVVEVSDDEPFPDRSLRLAPGLWHVLRGVVDWPVAFPALRRRHDIDIVDIRTHIVPIVAGREAVLVVVRGAAGRRADELVAAVTALFDSAGVPLVALDAEVAVDRGSLVSMHALVRGLVPVVRGRGGPAPLPDHPGPVVVCVEHDVALEADERPTVLVEVAARDLGEGAAMWSGLVPELNGDADHLAGIMRMDGIAAARAVIDARTTARLTGRPMSVDDVVRASRQRADGGLPASVRRVAPRASWDDLVTTVENEHLLRSVPARVAGQVQVLHEWGFGQRRRQGGVRILLAGPPGTGKTLSAEILASDLGLELLVVDLSALVSKWLGETEKNIGEVFDAAERNQAVLFFDEADAIFGRRTETSDAQSRWANLETAYLLSRVDRFDGLVILATNLRGNIDDAFVRRLDVIVEFDEPDEDDRRRLWQLHLPHAAPISDVDVLALASAYPVSGGVVHNATLAAAFRAATDGTPITQHHLLDAVEREYRKAGRTFPGRPRTRQSTPTGGI